MYEDLTNLDHPAQIAVGTDLKLWRLLDGAYWHFWYTNSNIDYNITSLGFAADGTLWIGNRDAINLQTPTLQFHRLGGYEIPYANVTSLPQRSGGPFSGVWLGTAWGLMRYDAANATGWRYFNGPRWLAALNGMQAANAVASVALLSGGEGEGWGVEQVLAGTALGLARISVEWWTLEQKAEYLQGLIYPRHDRYGQTADCALQQFGNLSSYQLSPSDNDGLWTNIYLASQAYRYAVTSSFAARNNSLHAWRAMRFLQQVTALPGYPARSFARYGDPGTAYEPGAGQHTWFNSTAYPGWVYKSDTSSDEIVGHQFGLPLYARLVAAAGDERRQAEALFLNITDWILANKLVLVSPLGEPTTWGFWDPQRLNHEADDYDERGVNSLQILAWLQQAHAAAASPSGGSPYLETFAELVARHGYGLNMINQKVRVPNDDNYSDDELAWLPYAAWIGARGQPDFAPFWLSINRTIAINAPEKSSLWNVIYLALGSADRRLGEGLLRDAIWCLQTWPLEQIDWPVMNSQRFDIVWRYYNDRGSDPNTLSVLRYDELTTYRWNSDPFAPNGGSGYGETDPSAWLLPYWMARYYKLIL